MLLFLFQIWGSLHSRPPSLHHMFFLVLKSLSQCHLFLKHAMEADLRVSSSMQSPSRKGSCPFSQVYFYLWATARNRGCWKVWWRNGGTVLCAQRGRRAPGREAAGLGTEHMPRHITGPSWGDKDGSQEQPFGYRLSAEQLPQPGSISLPLFQRGEGWEPATVLAVGMHCGGDLSSVRKWPGCHACQAHPFHEGEGSTVLMLCSPLSSLLHKESREPVLKDHFEADPCYQGRLNLGGEWDHLEQYPIDSCRHLPC